MWPQPVGHACRPRCDARHARVCRDPVRSASDRPRGVGDVRRHRHRLGARPHGRHRPQRVGPNRRFGQRRIRNAHRRVAIRARRVRRALAVGLGFGRFQPRCRDVLRRRLRRPRPPREDIGQAWFEAHNISSGMSVAAGSIGFLLLWGWVGTAARRSAGPLAWGCGALFVTWMLQPAALLTLPTRGVDVRCRSSRTSLGCRGLRLPTRRSEAVAGSSCRRSCSGSWQARLVVVDDVNLYRATDALDPQRSEQAARWWPW